MMDAVSDVSSLLSPSVTVIDPAPALVVNRLNALLAGRASVVGYDSRTTAEAGFEKRGTIGAPKTVLIVSDNMGLQGGLGSYVAYAKRLCPGVRIVGHSHQAPQDLVDCLLKESILDDFVRKPDPLKLDSLTNSLVNDFYGDSRLNHLREYILACREPLEPIVPDGSGKYLSIVDIFWEVAWQTPLGTECWDAWSTMV